MEKAFLHLDLRLIGQIDNDNRVVLRANPQVFAISALNYAGNLLFLTTWNRARGILYRQRRRPEHKGAPQYRRQSLIVLFVIFMFKSLLHPAWQPQPV